MISQMAINDEIMIKTSDIEALLSLCVLSNYVADERPVSAMLVSSVEAGKTEILRRFEEIDGVLWINDFTAYGIVTNYMEQLVSGKIRTIICPDFITPVSRSKDTISTLMAFLSGLIEDGIVSSATYASKYELGADIRVNLITALPSGILSDHRHKWIQTGFMSRILPISFSYSPQTTLAIRDAIGSGADRDKADKQRKVKLVVPDHNIAVNLTPIIGASFAYSIPEILNSMFNEQDDRPYGFRLQHHLQTLCKAEAIRNGRDYCTAEDFDRIIYFIRYINLKYTRI